MIIRIAAFVPLRQQFDYLCDEAVEIGSRVLIPFGKRKVTGIVVAVNCHSEFPVNKIKRVIKILDQQSLFSKNMLALIQFTSDYYQHPIGETYSAALPALLRKDKLNIDIEKTETPAIGNNIEKLNLNQEQQLALDAIKLKFNQSCVFVLDGVTGSGKTEIYIQAAHDVIKAKQQVLIIVPEISLTPQLIQRFEQRFGNICLSMHSALTPKKRLIAWNKAKSGEAKIIIGTRSSIFTPCDNLGMIIIDEEHDNSLKQHEGLKYSARDLSCVRSQLEKIPLILGSATPSFESLYNVIQKRYHYLRLKNRINNFDFPSWQVIDMRHEKSYYGLSQKLIEAIKKTLSDKNQVLIFLNRRGFSTIMLCESCGYSAKCKHCDTNLSYFKKENLLRCSQCDTHFPAIKTCLECSHPLSALGFGTERIEETLTNIFPSTVINRIDRDSTRKKGALAEKLDPAYQGKSQILVGTQMLAKGHHFPNVNLVAVLNIDSSLYSIDFRALERLAQLLMQVSGRAGRTGIASKVMLQTLCPDHQDLRLLLTKGYHFLAKKILKERRLASLPPYSHLTLISAEAKKIDVSLAFLEYVKTLLAPIKQLSIIGPAPSPITKRASFYRAQLLLQTNSRKALQTQLQKKLSQISTKNFSGLRWGINVDPQDIY